MPTFGAAAVGGTPVRADQIQSSWYAVAQTLVSGLQWILYNAAHRSKLRANAAGSNENLRDVIARDYAPS